MSAGNHETVKELESALADLQVWRDTAVRIHGEKEAIRIQRDELLEALKLAASIIGHPEDEHSKFIAAAIAKAEGK